MFHHEFGPSFAPPSQIERCQAVSEFAGVILAQKEVIVIKLYCIDPVGLQQVSQHALGAGRRFHSLPASRKGDNAAEVATIRATEACLMNRRAPAEKGRKKI